MEKKSRYHGNQLRTSPPQDSQHSFSGKYIPECQSITLQKQMKNSQKFAEITGIRERRYADENVVASDMGAEAGKKALASANLDPEKLDYIIVIITSATSVPITHGWIWCRAWPLGSNKNWE
ncbi:MAG: hypothetical protein U5K69_26325 [Balneolaceae bacterium]|nr:hypothetical protein [Balneolaceae bacterium]